MAITPHSPIAPTDIIVLAGGDSPERDVSLASGAGVESALRRRGHRVQILDPRDVNLEEVPWSQFDAVFLALHGQFGEDGQIQALLEEWQVPFTGSDSTASRLAFSKSASKERFAQSEVSTLPYVLIHVSDDAARIQQQSQALGYPLVVKNPTRKVSSLGVSIVTSAEQLPQALSRCFHFDSFGILEPALNWTEWTVCLFGDQVIGTIQIEKGRSFFDYQAKYHDNSTNYRFDFDFPADVIANIEKTGVAAAAALGTQGIARVDILLDKYSQPFVLEVKHDSGNDRP